MKIDPPTTLRDREREREKKRETERGREREGEKVCVSERLQKKEKQLIVHHGTCAITNSASVS